ncbi:MAG: tRNA (adenosine(37)-N6)-threonylcarbamoyltransferase complex ATPase subunit type 1 TsaE [Cryomorphaceae bacterium]|jgi:tRNA threonylcarbamoyladenosine biosynthesis protein TsaE|nr:tRNA (adenosine(37)-N6)-threonylcarbamoyltransferase complex ATPase subunit type 1 TsaE [Cryomorphaceae bacterium]MBT4237688.1 tRNA (adenosine(37)-N6)-threonylcarbamoyltransferase complex ATPase subunit type 1 TsaE [Cryomorphaceae bacterium]MBT4813852.1 tRNA (adenosine(37)-N6)-threonylcarbamoyltransferase complex ATPase subunit type 1 TsaE [Cryomorphaceae bacterium]MBT7695410.1 tRNA (adenosine(37)-N6)-threonylcarbamoyltransferase complex ATPase subunit type 1 TsaE [Cryomorphaceae bacterium]
MKIKFQINQLKEVAEDVKKDINTNIVLISGEMGVGKTTLIKEVFLSMNVIDNVSSPTFSIINEYRTKQNKVVYHMDLYRLKNISETEDIGLFEYLESGNLCIIEWGDMIEKLIDSKYDKFIISKQNESRIIEKTK